MLDISLGHMLSPANNFEGVVAHLLSEWSLQQSIMLSC